LASISAHYHDAAQLDECRYRMEFAACRKHHPL
jgi:hypothetical protein